jgi:UDP-glucose 4-epimerase
LNVSLVTGGAGFMGSHVAEHLLRLGHTVVILDDLSGGFIDNVPEGAIFVRGSILDEELIKHLFEKYGFKYVYHLAAYAAEGLSHFIKLFNYRNNLIGSINLINAAVNHEVKCFVFTSSIAVYGAGQAPMTEEMTPIPEDPYGIAKLCVEQELRVTHDMFGLEYVVFRPHNVYGERQNIGDPQLRAFTHINDVAPIIAESIDYPTARNEIFNIGADQPHTVNDLADIVATSMDKKCRIQHLDARNEVKIAFADHTKAENVFGKRKETSLEAGVCSMAEWVRRHGSRESSIFNEIEITKNMPLSWAKSFNVNA